jgi:hypothetical protein
MKTERLITALKEGKILLKKHNDDESCIEFLFQGQMGEHKWFESKGWGTAYGKPSDRLEDLYFAPEKWKIIKDFNMNDNEYPYPWSTIKTIEYELED